MFPAYHHNSGSAVLVPRLGLHLCGVLDALQANAQERRILPSVQEHLAHANFIVPLHLTSQPDRRAIGDTLFRLAVPAALRTIHTLGQLEQLARGYRLPDVAVTIREWIGNFGSRKEPLLRIACALVLERGSLSAPADAIARDAGIARTIDLRRAGSAVRIASDAIAILDHDGVVHSIAVERSSALPHSTLFDPREIDVALRLLEYVYPWAGQPVGAEFLVRVDRRIATQYCEATGTTRSNFYKRLFPNIHDIQKVLDLLDGKFGPTPKFTDGIDGTVEEEYRSMCAEAERRSQLGWRIEESGLGSIPPMTVTGTLSVRSAGLSLPLESLAEGLRGLAAEVRNEIGAAREVFDLDRLPWKPKIFPKRALAPAGFEDLVAFAPALLPAMGANLDFHIESVPLHTQCHMLAVLGPGDDATWETWREVLNKHQRNCPRIGDAFYANASGAEHLDTVLSLARTMPPDSFGLIFDSYSRLVRTALDYQDEFLEPGLRNLLTPIRGVARNVTSTALKAAHRCLRRCVHEDAVEGKSVDDAVQEIQFAEEEVLVASAAYRHRTAINAVNRLVSKMRGRQETPAGGARYEPRTVVCPVAELRPADRQALVRIGRYGAAAYPPELAACIREEFEADLRGLEVNGTVSSNSGHEVFHWLAIADKIVTFCYFKTVNSKTVQTRYLYSRVEAQKSGQSLDFFTGVVNGYRKAGFDVEAMVWEGHRLREEYERRMGFETYGYRDDFYPELEMKNKGFYRIRAKSLLG